MSRELRSSGQTVSQRTPRYTPCDPPRTLASLLDHTPRPGNRRYLSHFRKGLGTKGHDDPAPVGPRVKTWMASRWATGRGEFCEDIGILGYVMSPESASARQLDGLCLERFL